MRITTRGKVVAWSLLLATAFATGLATGNIAWDGTGYSDLDEAQRMWEVDTATDG